MSWICPVCERNLPDQVMRSRTWRGICIGCDDKVNDAVVRVLKLRPAVCPRFKIYKEGYRS